MGIGEVGELLRRSTVHITTVHIQTSGARRESAGSGVISDADGTIVTNAHVVGSGSRPGAHLVELWDGRTLPAEVTASDGARDLAKLKVSATGLVAARFRTSAVRPGELAIAVGNPLGFTGALTTGVVHATGAVKGLGRKPWIQAAIRLATGNSGGPLADAEGRVIGINTMFVSNGVVSGGIALAVPSAAVEAFVRHGPGPRLGVAIQPVRLNRKRGLGLLILSVDPGSPAEHTSLLIGDVLIGIDKAAFTAPSDLADAIADADSGRLKLRFFRGDQAREREVVVALAERQTSREAA